MVEARSDDELAAMQVQLPFLPAPIDAAAAAGFRLSEVALHSWDVLAAADPEAEVATDAAGLLVDRLPMMVGFIGQFTPRDTRPDVDTTIAVVTSAPHRRFELELGERVELRPADGAATAGELALPAGALLRLTSGRLRGRPGARCDGDGPAVARRPAPRVPGLLSRRRADERRAAAPSRRG